MKRTAAAAVGTFVATLLAACSSSGGNKSTPDCDRGCQSNLAAADGKTLPAGPAFELNTSHCALWNKEPNTVQYYLAGLYAQRLGADKPSFTLASALQKGITTACASYPSETVTHVATILRNADEQWPNA